MGRYVRDDGFINGTRARARDDDDRTCARVAGEKA